MRPKCTPLFRMGLTFLFVFPLAVSAFAQIPAARNRVIEAVDNHKLVTRFGSVHRLARPEFDRGQASDDLPASRMLLVLKRAPEQQTALDKLIEEQQVKSSPNYHNWLTPEEFGRAFGPSDADLAAVTNWLLSQGFQIHKVGAGRTVIEFSGTAGQVRTAFHTAIHKYVVNGEEHWANASDIQFPAALGPVVAGVATLHNFRKKPMLHGAMVVQEPVSGGTDPNYTTTCSDGEYCYLLGPSDFATIYNVKPLWDQGKDGAGQSVAIVGRTNIDIADVQYFRSYFGLPENDPEIILNGPDPKIVNSGEQLEANLDVQWAGAIAKGAKVKFVVSESTDVTDGVDLSAFYIVDKNLAPVMSASFGTCEAGRDAPSYAQSFVGPLWEQAAAQGITVMVSTGDNGSAGCDDPNSAKKAQYGLSVNVLASTPFNVAVGGTDFDQNSANYATYWNTTLGTKSSALSYIPETTWNESNPGIWAGSGGASDLWPKPSWQNGTGVPADGSRDLPDVSMFAASVGGHRSAYYVRQNGKDYMVGGTSASSPAFASVMALVAQSQAVSGYSGRQGNANYTLYNLAAQENLASCNSSTVSPTGPNSCVFYDTTKGNISVPCTAGTPNCTGGFLVYPSGSSNRAWTTTTGYDLATGLGSVNVANLVANWGNANFRPTTTTISSISPSTLMHGQSANVSVTVSPSSGSGTPTGDISLIADLGGGQSLKVDGFTLLNGQVSKATGWLPGGTYQVKAHYAGDGTFASSDSEGYQVTVTKEASKVIPGVVTQDYDTGIRTDPQATTAAYGSPYILEVNVTNSTGSLSSLCQDNLVPVYPCPSGTVTVIENGAPLDGGTFLLTALGFVDDQTIQLLPGTHNIAASYSGDNSFNASTGSTSIVITKAETKTLAPSLSLSTVAAGQSVDLSAKVTTKSSGAAPNGTVSFYDGGTLISGSPTYTGKSGTTSPASLTAKLATSFSTGGTHTVTAQYNGGAYYEASAVSDAVTIEVSGPSSSDFAFSDAQPAAITVRAGSSGQTTITVNSPGTYAGTVSFSCSSLPAEASCNFVPPTVSLSAGGTGTTALTISTTAAHTVSASLKVAGWLSGGVFVLGLFGSVGCRRKRLAVLLLLIALLGLVSGMAACGGGGSSPNTPQTRTDPGTPAGSYTVTVTGSDSGHGLSHTVSVPLTVQ